MTTQVVASVARTSDFTFKMIKKLQSVPAIAMFAFVGLLIGMCLYFGPLETYAPITNWYHTVFSNDYWRHLLIRAAPETTIAGWFAQCVAIISVVNGKLKYYRVMATHELFWRPFVGLLFMLPGAAAAAGIIWLEQHWNVGHRLHVAAKGFCSSGIHGHCMTNIISHTVSAHPGVVGQFEQSVILDGDKKLIVIAGLFFFGIWVMRSYFLNVQGWLAENRIIDVDAKNKDRKHRGKHEIPYTRLYHHLIPGYRLRILYIIANRETTVTDIKGRPMHVTVNMDNHKTVNNAIYKGFKAVTVAGILGGLYIMFFIAQGTQLALSVVH